MTGIITFPASGLASQTDVGGKGRSLIRMAAAGVPVLAGAVVPSALFEPWFDEIRASRAWQALPDTPPERWTEVCEQLKALARELPPTSSQQRTFAELHAHLKTFGPDARFAVRSSSPDEDLGNASFAGCYSTSLGVPPGGVDAAVRACFVSSLDARVFRYKREHGIDVLTPRIAVVVQRQIDSEVAGVAFSLNPLTNDFDEALVNANWGQAESVVAGLASPDEFIVNKLDRRVIERKLGAKQVSTWLADQGGTRERSNHRSAEYALDDAGVLELTDALCRIEQLFDHPVDVEWARSDGRLHILQARPITAYVPLPPEMTTRPGERRRLYVDAALSKGMTTNAPFSPMLLDWYRELLSGFVDARLGIDVTPAEGIVFAAGGRLYMNLSNTMWLASPTKMATAALPTDVSLARIFAGIDTERYRAAGKPAWLRWRLLRKLPGVLWLMRGNAWRMLATVVSPRRSHDVYRRSIAAFERALGREIDSNPPLSELGRRCLERVFAQPTMGTLVASLAAQGFVDRLAGNRPEARALAAKLRLGASDDVVVEMGIAMYRLAKHVGRHDFDDLERLAGRIERREMPPAVLEAWDGFVAAYGWRGPLEMDLASPRYAEDCRLALRQMSSMAVDDARFDPQAAHARHVAARRDAYEQLRRRSGWLGRLLLRRAYTIIDLFGGSRDMPKHQIALATYALRMRALTDGSRLVRAGRLDRAEDVFDLTFADIERADADVALDLRALRVRRRAFVETLHARVTEFPQVIDSRGRILRPPPGEEEPGELSGSPISPGVARGPVKLLRYPDEKRIDTGDVLVAYTTDPGWTPLFVSAAGVVLEIGGVLQHGAVVAREYGKPCVAGVDRVMSRLRDGQIVEVDGTAGVIRLVSQ